MKLLVVLMLATLGANTFAAPKSKAKPAATKPADPPADAPKADPVPAPVPAPVVVAPAPAPEPAPAPIAPTTGKPKLIVVGLSAAGGLDATLAESLTETLAAEISRTNLFEVTSQKDLATVLGIERQKQMLGCSAEASSCMSELAGALGARFVVSGSIAKLGDVFQLNLQTQDTARAQTLGRATRLASDLTALRAQLPYAIAEATATPPPTPPSKVLPVTLISVGGAAGLGAGVLFFQAFTREQAAVNELTLGKQQPQLVLKPASYYAAEAAGVAQLRLIGAITGGVGAALLVTGIILFPHEDSGARVALVPLSNGAALAGTW